MEELECRWAGTYFVDYMGGMLWVLLVERHRYEPYDAFEVVEGDWQEGFRSIASAHVASGVYTVRLSAGCRCAAV